MDAVAAYQGKPPPWPLQSPFGLAQGYLDFRCLPLGVIPRHRRLEKVDLSGATDERGGQLHECTMIDCKLDRVSMETNLGKHFERCSFLGARFSHSTWRGVFIECDFTRCDLSRSLGSQLKFVRCVFKDAKLLSLRFHYSTFDNCIWEGAKFGAAGLNKPRFIGTKPSEEQLHRASTPGMTFEAATPA
jgi:uncharacterized protein YjbI with pentapeptide repeats